MAILKEEPDFVYFRYFPSEDTLARIKKTAACYREQYPDKTEKEAMEDVVDGCIEEGWELDR